MTELALFYHTRDLVFLKEVAEREGISEKYLTQLVIPLRAKGFIASRRGAGGGYRLARHPSQITVREVVEVLEGGIALVECVVEETACPRSFFCPARKVWKTVQERVMKTLEEFTLEDLAQMYREKDFSLDYTI